MLERRRHTRIVVGYDSLLGAILDGASRMQKAARQGCKRCAGSRLFSRACRSTRGSPGHTTLRDLLLQPKSVMRLGPIEIDLPGPHGLERTLGTKRADVDM